MKRLLKMAMLEAVATSEEVTLTPESMLYTSLIGTF